MKLVLEGGGVRAAYSAGVCKALIDHGLKFQAVVGSSSGSVNAAFFAAQQMAELLELWIDFVPSDRFVSWRRQLTPFAGPGLGIDEMLDGLVRQRLDLSRATAGAPDLYITATNVDGCLPSVARPNAANLIEWLRASMAIPGAYNRLVHIDGADYIDGGVATPVPFDIEELEAYPEPTVVVLTRPMTTRKPPMTWYEKAFVRSALPRAAQRATLTQHELHNRTMQRLRTAADQQRVIVSNPPADLRVKRLTRDKASITDGVKQGLVEGTRLAQQLSA